MIDILEQALALSVLRPLDVQFARVVANEAQPDILLAAACLSAHSRIGHVCLPLEQLLAENLFDGRQPELALAAWQACGQPGIADWQQKLAQAPAVSDGRIATPMVLQQQRLYLQRLWQSEGEVAAFINSNSAVPSLEESRLRAILDQLFGEAAASPDWQKIAAAVALTRRIAVISGGPGTGKTTTVAKLLAALVQLNTTERLRIELAAPTGKAAARLTESLGYACRQLDLPAAQRALFPTEAATLHRLLGAQPNSQRMRYHRENPLHLDVLVVDEASMIDLPMMAKLIAALPARARIIFLGDRDQLASVEAGAVLGDICRFAEQGYSEERAAQLARLTGFVLPAEQVGAMHSPVRDSLCLLRKSYRFDSHSGIGQLALAVNAGDGKRALAVLSGSYNDVAHYPLDVEEDHQQLLNICVEGYRPYLQLVAQGAEPGVILAAFGCFQLICALREGPFGVSGLNARIEQQLQHAGLILRQPDLAGRWYLGRPVMISRNDSALGVFNGDIGILLPDAAGDWRVHFQLPDGTIKSVQPSRLPAHETAYAMTVHKSQGSEFDHTALVLPNHFLPVLSRELVYTAITRARKQLSLYTTSSVLLNAIATPTQRRSGLTERLSLAEPSPNG